VQQIPILKLDRSVDDFLLEVISYPAPPLTCLKIINLTITKQQFYILRGFKKPGNV